MSRAERRAVRHAVRWAVWCVCASLLGRRAGSTVRGSVRVRERVVVSASGQAAEAARKSRDEIRLG